MKLVHEREGMVREAMIVSWLNRPPSKCKPVVHVVGVGDLALEDCTGWYVVQASRLERRMLTGIGITHPPPPK